MNKEKIEILKEGIIQLVFTAFIYLLWVILGFISVITIGLIIQSSIVLMWVQGAILLCTNITGIYLSYDFLKE